MRRISGTLKALTGGVALRHAVGSGEPYRAPEEFRRDLVTVRDFLLAHHGAVVARGRLAELIRAVDVFGFHMATTDLRQNSDQHEAVLKELLAAVRIVPDYSALIERDRIALLLQLLADRRVLRAPDVEYSANLRSELAVFETARSARQRSATRPSAITSSAIPKASATFWKSWSCRRNAA